MSEHPALSLERPSRLSAAEMLPRGRLLPFALVTSLFFLWGIPNNLNDVLIRQFMKSFAISRFQAGLVQSAFYLGYFFLATPAAIIMRRTGYKAGILIGLILFALGSFLFWPAALVRSYSFFLFALFVIASGLAFLETASNPFIAQLGPPGSAERRLNFSQAFNPLGSICGVLIGTVFIFSGMELSPQQIAHLKFIHQYGAYLTFETQRILLPYMVLGGIALVLAFAIAAMRFPSLPGEHEGSMRHEGQVASLLRSPSFMSAVFAQFMYVGAQVCTWSYFIPYIEQYTYQSEKTAGYLLTGTLAAFGLGRFASTGFMRLISPTSLMGIFSVANIVLLWVAVGWPGWIGMWAIFLTSFFMSLMYPTIFSLALRGLGPYTKTASSLLVMAIIGGAILTPAMGFLSQIAHNLAIGYLVPMSGYLVTAMYSFVWSKAPFRMD